jgi:hypothetical protein
MRISPQLALLLFVAAIALTACGGSSSDDDSSGGSKVKKTTLELGESAKLTGPYKDKPWNVSYTVDAKEGDIADLKDFNLEDKEQKMTPWYVTETAKNEGDKLTSKDAYGVSPDVLDDGGVEAKEITLLGDFDRCDLNAPPDPFPAGESYTTCHVYLVPKGSTLAKIVIEETKFEGANNEFTWKVS